MINVEKLIREGKTLDEITEMFHAEFEAANKKVAEEKEAARITEEKKVEIETAVKVAQEALQKVYDLTSGGIHIYINKDGKVSVTIRSNNSANKKSKYNSLTEDYRRACDDNWDRFFKMFM